MMKQKLYSQNTNLCKMLFTFVKLRLLQEMLAFLLMKEKTSIKDKDNDEVIKNGATLYR